MRLPDAAHRHRFPPKITQPTDKCPKSHNRNTPAFPGESGLCGLYVAYQHVSDHAENASLTSTTHERARETIRLNTPRSGWNGSAPVPPGVKAPRLSYATSNQPYSPILIPMKRGFPHPESHAIMMWKANRPDGSSLLMKRPGDRTCRPRQPTGPWDRLERARIG